MGRRNDNIFVSANNRKKEAQAQSIAAFSTEDVKGYQDRYEKILAKGQQEFLSTEEKDYNGEDMKLLRRLKEYKMEHLMFIVDFRVPFDNNQAERDLRMIKTKTKVSGCFRGLSGGVIFAKIKSYTATLRKNDRNIYEGIKSAFRCEPVLCRSCF